MTETNLPATTDLGEPDLTPSEDTGILNVQQGFQVRDFDELWKWANGLAKAKLCPEGFQGKPFDVLMALQAGQELGVGLYQSLQSIHVIKGKVTLSAELRAAILQQSPQCTGYSAWVEKEDPERPETWTGHCLTSRAGDEPVEDTFSWGDAKRAGLTSRGTWKEYPEDMLIARAITRHTRRHWADLMKGMASHEEVMDTTYTRGAAQKIEQPKLEQPKLDTSTGTAVDPMLLAAGERTEVPPEEPAAPLVDVEPTGGWTMAQAMKISREAEEEAERRPLWFSNDDGEMLCHRCQVSEARVVEHGPSAHDPQCPAYEPPDGAPASSEGPTPDAETGSSDEAATSEGQFSSDELAPVPWTEGNLCPMCDRHRQIVEDVGHSDGCEWEEHPC